MIQVGSQLHVADNSGAKKVVCIKVLNKKLEYILLINSELYVLKNPNSLFLQRTLWSKVVPLLQCPIIKIGSFIFLFFLNINKYQCDSYIYNYVAVRV